MSEKPTTELEKQTSRREVIKKAVYMTPVILTLAAVPAFAAKGSHEPKEPKEPKKLKKPKKDEE
jgi:hypothetical protein